MSKGGSDIPANTTSQVTNRIDLPPFVSELAGRNMARAEDLSNQPFTPYPGQTVAPINPLQQAGYNVAQSQLYATQPVFQKALGQVEDLPGSAMALLNPYLKNVEDAAVSNIQRQGEISHQNLASGAVGQHAFGGTRYGVEEALLDSETQRNIGQTVAQIQSQGWNTAVANALQQAGAEGSLATAGQNAALTGAQAAIGAGGAQQTQQQAELSDALHRWSMQQDWPYSQLAIAQGALAGTPYGTSTTSSQPYSRNQTANLLGNIAAGVGLLGAGSNLFSSGGLFGSAGPLFSQSGLFGSAGALSSLFGGSTAATGAALGAQGALAGGGTAALGGLTAADTAAALEAAGLGASAAGSGFAAAGAALL